VKNGIVEYLENHGVIDNSTYIDWERYQEFVHFIETCGLIHFFITKSDVKEGNSHYFFSIVLEEMPQECVKTTLQGWIKTLFYGYRVRCTLKFLNGKNAVAEKKEAVL